MPIPPLLPDSNTLALGLPILPLMVDIFWGVLGLIIVLVFHGSGINHINMRFERLTNVNLKSRQYNRVFLHFYASFIFIALIHMAEIVIWSTYIVKLHLVQDPIAALLFVGSCYTTVGFISDILPVGWKSLAFFIAFTGLFSLAWTTSVMIGMTNTYKAAWNLKYGQDEFSDS